MKARDGQQIPEDLEDYLESLDQQESDAMEETDCYPQKEPKK